MFSIPWTPWISEDPRFAPRSPWVQRHGVEFIAEPGPSVHPAFPASSGFLSRSQPRSTGTVRGDGMDKTHKARWTAGMEKGETTGDFGRFKYVTFLIWVGIKSNFCSFYIVFLKFIGTHFWEFQHLCWNLLELFPVLMFFFKSDMYWIDMDGLSFDEIAFILFRLGFYRDLLGMFPVLMVFLLEIVWTDLIFMGCSKCYWVLLGIIPTFIVSIYIVLLEIYEHASRILRMGVHQNHGFQYYNGLILR